MRSAKGLGTTVKVVLPVRCPSSGKDGPHHIKPPSCNAGIGFIGFGSLDNDEAKDTVHSEGSKRLLSSLSRTCKQLDLPCAATNDAFESTASIYVIREQEKTPGQFSMASDSKLRRSLLATRKPLIFICASRESTMRLKSIMALDFVNNIQYLWPPIGPTKLINAISACRTYHPFPSLLRSRNDMVDFI